VRNTASPASDAVRRQFAREDEWFRALDAGITDEERVWCWETPSPAVVLGAFGRVSREVREVACVTDGMPVLRRRSGGGTVVVGPGCLAYGILLSLDRRPALRQVAASYRAILEPIASALAVPGLAVAGTGDLALDGRKVGGSAQRRGRRTLLHHGTLLYGFDILLIERYLRRPPHEPAYRAGRSHAAFVTNLPLPRERLESAIHAAWPLGGSGAAGHGLPAAPAL
jgi:lipoate---protein ligase